MESWKPTIQVHLGPDCNPEISLVNLEGGFRIYSFDMTGETRWNYAAAQSLAEKLKDYSFDAIATVQTKSCGLAQALTERLGLERFLEIRKSRKGFMIDPVGVTVDSITTTHQQELWIGREKYQAFTGKRLCFLDDVVSTGGTIQAVLALARKLQLEISVVACVLTEGTPRREYQGIPIVSLDHIPLPGTSLHP
ncbi:MAG: phosphoribosyltransferase family protein [Oligosphaeraceae bacterium]